MCVGIKDLSLVMLTALVHFLSSLHALSSSPPLLPRVTAVGRNRTPWETVLYFHFLASFFVLEWGELQPQCPQALPHVASACCECLSHIPETHPGAHPARQVRSLNHLNVSPTGL